MVSAVLGRPPRSGAVDDEVVAMRNLADNGRHVLAEEHERLLFFERRILPTWLVFVPGLLTVIAVGNAVIQVAVGNVAVAGVLLLVGVACGAGLRATMLSRRRAKERPLEAPDAVLVIDLAARTLLEADGRVLSELDRVRVQKAMQLTSSAKALTIVWPGGTRVVYRGDALLPRGSIDAPAQILRERGLATG